MGIESDSLYCSPWAPPAILNPELIEETQNNTQSYIKISQLSRFKENNTT